MNKLTDMKKITLILVALTLSMGLFSQSKMKKGIEVGDQSAQPNVATIDSITKVGGRLIHYTDGAVTPTWDDSITVSFALIDELTSTVTTLAGLVESLLAVTGDTTAPVLSYGNVYEDNPGTWVFNFSEALATADNDSVLFGLSLTENGASVTPDSFSISASTLNVYTPSVAGGSTLRVSWDEPVSNGLRDIAANNLRSFVDSTVKVYNNAVYSIDYLAWYKFDGDFTDESGTSPGTKIGTITFEGDSAAVFSGSGGTDYIDIGSPGITGNFSISYLIEITENANENYYIWTDGNDGASGDGISSMLDGAGNNNMKNFIRAGNGAASSWADGTSGDLVVGTRYNVTEVYDVTGNGTDAYAQIWVDGVMVNSDDTIIAGQSPLNYSNDFWLGTQATPVWGLREGAVLDEFKIFNYRLTPALIDSLNTNRYRMPFTTDGGGYVPGGTGSDSIFDFHASSSFRYPEQPYTDAMAVSDFNGEWASQVRWSDITITASGDTSLRFNALDNSHGINFDIYFPATGYEEQYISYDLQLKDDIIIYPADANTSDFGLKLPGLGGLSASDNHDLRLSSSAANDISVGWTSRGRIDKDGGWLGQYMTNYVDYQQTPSTGFYPGTFIIDGNGQATIDNCERFNYTLRVVMNDVGVANGIYNLYVDGVCKYARNDMEWRGSSNVDLDYVRIAFYFGGAGTSSRAEYADMFNFAVFQYESDVAGSADYPTVKTKYIANSPGEKIPLPSITFVHE